MYIILYIISKSNNVYTYIRRSMETYDVIDFSRRLLSDLHVGIINLKLQKLMYFIYGTYYFLKDKEIFNERPQAWNYGSVFPKVFYKYRSSVGGDIDNSRISSDLEIDDRLIRNKRGCNVTIG